MKNNLKRIIALLFSAALILHFVHMDAVQVNANAAFTIPVPVASGTNQSRNNNAEIDYSNVRDGYVMIRFLQRTNLQVRVIIIGPNDVRYQYNLRTDGQWEVFPLTAGNGQYSISVFTQIEGSRFSLAHRVDANVTLVDQFAPFLRSNQFVSFNQNSQVVSLAADVTRGSANVIDSIGRVFNWVVDNIEYDFELAANVRSGYVPNLDQVLQRRRGICFDYASLMTAMLRSQGIPTQLVIGYVGTVFHAWISVYSPETGWINNVIEIRGNQWRVMDPTFASTANQSAEVIQFIGTGTNHRPTHFH